MLNSGDSRVLCIVPIVIHVVYHNVAVFFILLIQSFGNITIIFFLFFALFQAIVFPLCGMLHYLQLSQHSSNLDERVVHL